MSCDNETRRRGQRKIESNCSSRACEPKGTTGDQSCGDGLESNLQSNTSREGTARELEIPVPLRAAAIVRSASRLVDESTPSV
jgi:hypothetical protein